MSQDELVEALKQAWENLIASGGGNRQHGSMLDMVVLTLSNKVPDKVTFLSDMGYQD